MDYVYPTKVDRIGFLSTSSIKSPTFVTSSAGSTKSRVTYVAPKETMNIPESIEITHEGLKYRVFLSLDGQTCFKCKQGGHIAAQCPTTIQQSTILANENSSAPSRPTEETPAPIEETSMHARDYVDTVHYLSPATTVTAARTEYEGDLAYQHLLDAFRPEAADLSIGDLRSTLSSVSTELECEDALPQRTLAIVKPEAMKYQDVVLRAVKEAGLKILAQRVIHLTPEQVSEIYQKHYGSPAFPNMVVTVSVSPVLVLSLAGRNAIEKWKTMVGPYEILREEWFFPYSVRTRYPQICHHSGILEPIAMEEDKVSDYINQFVRPTLLQGLSQVVYKKPIDPVLFLAEWLLLNNPYQPQMPERVALTPL
nr:unnamed protein product [Callosobruchus analis]